jgi:serine/threonine protein phosphatase PrpC
VSGAGGDRLRVAVSCTRGVGPERGGRARNEDNYLIAQDGRVRFRDGGAERRQLGAGVGLLCAVADGMGGHDNGELASAAAVQALLRLYDRGRPHSAEDALLGFVQTAHARLRDRARARAAGNMGCTLTTLWAAERTLAWVHVGDSRLYLLRGGTLTQLSRDHTRGEFARRDSRPIPLAAHSLTQNFIFGSRNLGDDDLLRLDKGLDSGTLTLQVGDRLLLSSDGVHGPVPAAQLAEILQRAADPAQAALWLTDQAMANGGTDNTTALVVQVDALASWDLDADDWKLWEDGAAEEPPTAPVQTPPRR